MKKAAQELFSAELELPMNRLVNALHRLVKRVDRPWDRLLTHAATALLTSALTWAVTADNQLSSLPAGCPVKPQRAYCKGVIPAVLASKLYKSVTSS